MGIETQSIIDKASVSLLPRSAFGMGTDFRFRPFSDLCDVRSSDSDWTSGSGGNLISGPNPFADPN